jgi:hypothetical protein
MMNTTSNQAAVGSPKIDKLGNGGQLDVGDDGTGHFDGSVSEMKGVSDLKSIDNKVVALYAKKPSAPTGESGGAGKQGGAGKAAGEGGEAAGAGVSAEACGVLSVGHAQEPQG